MGRKRDEKPKGRTPDKQASNRRSGRGGIAPPAEHQFRPGQSGNPNGRPKTRTLTELIRVELDRAEKGGKTLAQVIAEVFVDRAAAGHFVFAKEVIDRVDGKVPERYEDITPGRDDDDARLTVLTDTLRKRGGKAGANGHPQPGHPGGPGGNGVGGPVEGRGPSGPVE
jgi:hypothetical protein